MSLVPQLGIFIGTLKAILEIEENIDETFPPNPVHGPQAAGFDRWTGIRGNSFGCDYG
jgi:hypothetical protein